MIVITRRAIKERKSFVVWRRSSWRTPFFAKLMGETINRRAKLIVNLPFGFGLFWSYGQRWYM